MIEVEQALQELDEAQIEAVAGGGQRPGDPPPQFPEWPEELFGSRAGY
ncbi:hypothetical protein P5705_16130 [Pseudomonas entomophila]|nr:hypothetical protein [Pseudomonas entomophila]MDF9619173.1 hypothetical protein [Pseudomonas entomophila]